MGRKQAQSSSNGVLHRVDIDNRGGGVVIYARRRKESFGRGGEGLR